MLCTFFKGLFALFCHFFKGLLVAKIQTFLLKRKEIGMSSLRFTMMVKRNG